MLAKDQIYTVEISKVKGSSGKTVYEFHRLQGQMEGYCDLFSLKLFYAYHSTSLMKVCLN